MKKVFLIVSLVTFTITFVSAQKGVATKEFNNTLTAYFNTKNALAKDNAPLASESAKALIGTIDNFSVKTLTEKQQGLWRTESETIKTAATAISKEKAIAVQRKSFWSLSSAMIKLAKSFNLNAASIYVQYCPMAKKSWLSEVEAVQNPFYGSMMYDCGEVTETIAKK